MNTGALMRKWGFVNLSDCLGKTVKKVETMAMEYGSVAGYCELVEFTDGTRAWTIGSPARGIIPGPNGAELAKSKIITPEEYGEYVAEKKRARQAADERLIQEKREQLERLKRELEEEE